MDFGIALLPGVEPGSAASFIGGDIVVVPKGSKRVDDAVDFMKFLLSDEVQVEGYAKMLNLTTRADMADNKYFQAEPLVQDVAKALAVGRTPYTLKFFELINSPQGPWLQMLQRAYYTDDDLDTIIADAKAQMKADRLRQVTTIRPGPRRLCGAAAHVRRRQEHRRRRESGGRHARRPQRSLGFLYLRRRCCSCWPSRPTHSSRWSGCRCTTGR